MRHLAVIYCITKLIFHLPYRQMNQMEEFEREQNSKFMREIEDHKKQLELQQMEHRKILDQQRSVAKEQLKVLQVKNKVKVVIFEG